MVIELSDLTFTNQADIILARGVDQLVNNGSANTLDGNDLLISISTSSRGILNLGSLDTGDGRDSIVGTGEFIGILNRPNGTINTGDGSDLISGTGRFYGILNSSNSTLDTGSGNDFIIGYGNDIGGNGIFSQSLIDTGRGNDVIFGNSKSSAGINNNANSVIETGSGNDIITGIGGFTGITNFSDISMGAGKDLLIGASADGRGIINHDTINMGEGNDTVDAREGGFAGRGFTTLREGNDVIKGFGSGTFDGGRGRDNLELTSGEYTVRLFGRTTSIISGGVTMNLTRFERLIAGDNTFNFAHLTEGQTITIP